MWRFHRKDIRPRIEDPIFGPIVFQHGIWESLPAAAKREFRVTISAPPEGPTELQSKHFQRIIGDVGAIQIKAIELIKARAKQAVDLADLSIYLIEIGTEDECRGDRFTMELTDEAAVIIHRVSFESGVAVSYEYDE